MLTFLVVDDEPIIRENIVYLLGKSEQGPFHILEAADGKQALEILNNQWVDVALMDIRMPELSGLDMMTWVRETGWPGKYIVISGYSQFDYVHKALESGAAHYILKPVDEAQFHTLISDLIEEIHRDEHRELIAHHYPVQRRENRFLRREGLLNRQLAGQSAADGNKEEPGDPLVMGVLLCNADEPDLPRAELHEEARSLIQSCLAHDVDFGILENYGNDHEIILVYSPEDDAFEDGAMPRISQAIARALEAAGIADRVSYAVAAASGGASRLADAHHMCHERLKLRFSRGPVFFADMEPPPESRGDAARPELYDPLPQIDLKNCGVDNLLREQLANVFTPPMLEEVPIDVMRGAFWEIMRKIGEGGLSQTRKNRYSLDYFDTAEDIIDFFSDMARDIKASKNLGGTFRQYRKKIVDYIHANYGKSLTLTEVAEHFMFHPSYFSGAFHDMMHISFNDYVTELRLNHAIGLLLESDLSVRAIAEAVGYKSQSYFQRVFKKEIGVTPVEYRIKPECNQNLSGQ